MILQKEIIVSPEFINNKDYIYKAACKEASVPEDEIKAISVRRKSVDARKKNPVFVLLIDIYVNESPTEHTPHIDYVSVNNNKRVLIVGFGPAGMFAALRLIELGIKPLIFERGKNVRDRRKDLHDIQQLHKINPESNYCFGEGGAGTFSDGKLYTRSNKRGDVRKILNVLVQHGADEDILIEAHPHIGSNKLPKIIQEIRETILNCGGEIHFNSKVTDIIVDAGEAKGLKINDIEEITGDAVILSAGHSARDIFELLDKKNILIEPKPFAMGVRIEHPQSLINEIQYHSKIKNENLPPASYNVSCNIDDRGIYSFCMCPGGIIIPAATAPGEIVLNGMSLSRRDSPFANSGFVVSIGPKDWTKYSGKGALAALMLQKELESLAFSLGNNSQSAPAQRVTDFVNKKYSSSLPKTSYIPGVISTSLHEALPAFMSKALQRAIKIFDQKMKGYYSEEAQILAVESRTSSPVKIPRDKITLMHTQLRGLFPCAEGAGYAGGIVSAAIDGENCADAINKYLSK